jgi:hypothetical protein
MTLSPEPTPYATDAQLAQRLRQVAVQLRQPALARELLEVARILDPDPPTPPHEFVGKANL